MVSRVNGNTDIFKPYTVPPKSISVLCDSAITYKIGFSALKDVEVAVRSEIHLITE